ncbi:MAG: Crp/Fnr family transcriptional regulator [Saprospiraceae bacterium]|nr:Crp/Fnr family transcriptional regulator [Saprospiraceae bacterium]MCB0624357.1 Crp/Fnr family transcriptional regulator [Saprospiraceae bacterium]MCB0678427.1 Crp/Fnr family transcriptional regulator [Saprospiraceae bacterium]
MKTDSITEFIRNYPLFSVLSEEEKEQLMGMVQHGTLAKYSYIYQEGMPSDHMYFLAKGVVKIGTHSDDGREVIKAVLHPMALFGELGIIGETHRREFAKVMNEEVHYCSLAVADFRALMQVNHELCIQVLSTLGQRLQKVERRLESLIFKDARTRIIDFLKDTARQRGRKVGFETLLKHCLTQQDIANITGTSRQTVTSVLNELKKENLIYFNRRSILIRDLGRLS